MKKNPKFLPFMFKYVNTQISQLSKTFQDIEILFD